jgi:hypothetical protein
MANLPKTMKALQSVYSSSLQFLELCLPSTTAGVPVPVQGAERICDITAVQSDSKLTKLLFARYSKPREYSIVEVPLPELRDDDVLVKVKACGVCGTGS